MMSIRRLALFCTVLIAILLTGTESQERKPASADMQGIERLHQSDVRATISGDPKALAGLFTDDGVLLEPDSPAIVGRQAILSANEKNKAQHPSLKVLAYKPQIKDLKILDGWAFEWTYFEASYKESETGQPQTFHAKALRVLKREPNGEWRFSRVLWNLAPSSSR